MGDRKSEGLARKLFDDFNAAFLQLSHVNEVCIICNEDETCNKCPVHVEAGCIGVEQWCVKYLFSYAYDSLMKERKKTPQNTDYLAILTRCVVIFCPDCTTAWNMRRKVLCQLEDATTRSAEELHLCTLSLRRLPKSTEVFAYRRWILKSVFEVDATSPQVDHRLSLCTQCAKHRVFYRFLFARTFTVTRRRVEMLQGELSLCGDVSSRHPSNYSCWSHRVWVVNTLILPPLLTSLTSPNSHAAENIDLYQALLVCLINDMNDVTGWIERHVSDHSSMSYVQFLLHHVTILGFMQQGLACLCTASRSMLMRHCSKINLLPLWRRVLNQVEQLLRFYDGEHEALWCHRRALMVLLRKYTIACAGEQTNKTCLGELTGELTLEREKDFCAVIMSKQSNSSAYKYADNYLKYLIKYVFD